LRQNNRKNPIFWAPFEGLQGKKRAFGAFFAIELREAPQTPRVFKEVCL
jgi:hypothetical protein